jgi:hypothetical protein
VWRDYLNTAFRLPNDITPGTVIQQDLLEWMDRFGHSSSEFGAGALAAIVPEPATFLLIVAAAIAVASHTLHPSKSSSLLFSH